MFVLLLLTRLLHHRILPRRIRLLREHLFCLFVVAFFFFLSDFPSSSYDDDDGDDEDDDDDGDDDDDSAIFCCAQYKAMETKHTSCFGIWN